MSELELHQTQWVFAGRRTGYDDKLVYLWVKFEDGEWATVFLFTKNKNRLIIGGEYTVSSYDPEFHSVYVGYGDRGPKYIRHIEDEAKIVEWKALDRAAYITSQNCNEAKLRDRTITVESALKPIVKAMKETNYVGRINIMSLVISALNKEL